MNRRSYLATLGTGALGALAGCGLLGALPGGPRSVGATVQRNGLSMTVKTHATTPPPLKLADGRTFEAPDGTTVLLVKITLENISSDPLSPPRPGERELGAWLRGEPLEFVPATAPIVTDSGERPSYLGQLNETVESGKIPPFKEFTGWQPWFIERGFDPANLRVGATWKDTDWLYWHFESSSN